MKQQSAYLICLSTPASGDSRVDRGRADPTAEEADATEAAEDGAAAAEDGTTAVEDGKTVTRDATRWQNAIRNANADPSGDVVLAVVDRHSLRRQQAVRRRRALNDASCAPPGDV